MRPLQNLCKSTKKSFGFKFLRYTEVKYVIAQFRWT
jgi:hypothetical protein